MRTLSPEQLGGSAAHKEALLRFLRGLEWMPQARQAVVFGSLARGDATSESDVDIAIHWQGDPEDGQWRCSQLAVDVVQATGVRVSPLVYDDAGWHRLRTLDSGFYAAVRREGVVVAG
jgi:uncharacterized protein